MRVGAGIALAVTLFILVPLLLIWGLVIWDIVRRQQMSVTRKVMWALACSIVFPAQIVYLLVRPQHGRAELAGDRHDPHARLVDAALGHEDGLLDPAGFARVVAELRGGTAAS